MDTELTLIEEATAGPGPPGFHLLVMSPDSFQTVPLPQTGPVVIGRSSESVIKLDDPLASRKHAILHVGEVLLVEDARSANGTRVRDQALKPSEKTRIEPGEAIVVGSTVLMVQPNRPVTGTRRLWSHPMFEGRLEDECARSAANGSTFALVRLRVDASVPWTRVVPVLAREIPPPHGLASYGPRDFETLFVDIPEVEVERLLGLALAGLRGAGVPVRSAVAHYPRDGRSAEALLAVANGRLSPAKGGFALPAATLAVDASMARARELASRAAYFDINVLILGETGVGKEVFARRIHDLSARRDRPFVALNCAALPESLIENELFGHEKGAFTGATSPKLGLLETANGGTLLLDEIGEMPFAVQARLLRVLETRELTPVGGTKTRPIDVRFLAATNRDLETSLTAGTFRSDLFFRLNGLMIVIPPLRDRPSEIAELSQLFLEQTCRAAARPLPTITPEAAELLASYRWPGNIRELKNVIERAVVLCDGDEIDLFHLPTEKMRGAASLVLPSDPAQTEARAVGTVAPGGVGSWTTAQQEERHRILQALREHAGNQTAAARSLRMARRTFVARLDRYKISRPRKGP